MKSLQQYFHMVLQWNLYWADTKPGPEINVSYFPL